MSKKSKKDKRGGLVGLQCTPQNGWNLQNEVFLKPGISRSPGWPLSGFDVELSRGGYSTL